MIDLCCILFGAMRCANDPALVNNCPATSVIVGPADCQRLHRHHERKFVGQRLFTANNQRSRRLLIPSPHQIISTR
jgi:hypothetical protein